MTIDPNLKQSKIGAWYHLTLFLLVGFTCAVVLAMAGILWYNSTVNRRALQIMVDCTTPGHTCYEEGQKRTGEAVNQIIEAVTKDRDKRECE